MRAESLDFLRQIVNAPSPSGYEERAAKLFREYTQSFCDQVTTDVHGNVAAALNPNASCRIMLAGHMDEIGFIVHFISEEGMLYFSAIGDHDAANAIGQRVWIHTSKSRVPGVIGRKPVHLLNEEERKHIPALDELWIDIGVSSRAEAEALVELGDIVTYEVEFQRFPGDRAVARGFDNKMGAFIVAEAARLLKEEGGLHPEVGVYAVATVEEEVGYRGASTAAFGIDAKTGVAVDVSHATDYPAMSKQKHGDLEIGKGPAITRGSNINAVVFRMLVAAAKEHGIPHQLEIAAGSTGTDAHVMQTSRSGMATGLLGVPIRYMHTPCELLSLTDVENCAKLMAAYCRAVTPQTDFTPR